MKKSSKKRIAIYAIAAIVLIAALYLINNPITGNAFSTSSNTTTTKYDFSRTGNPDYYSLLPPKPDDFDQIKTMMDLGYIRDFPDRINESYWKQPEWFPSYDVTFVRALDNQATINGTAVWGIGVYDAQLYRVINKDWLTNPTMPETPDPTLLEIKNDIIVLRHRFWMRAAIGAVQIFGVGLYPYYPSQTTLIARPAFGIESRSVKQDPEEVKKYIKVSAVESDCDCTEFNMGMYFPKLSPDYQKQAWVTVEVNKNTPKGIYVVAVEVGGPSKDYQEQQSLKYGLVYTDPNIAIHINPVSFELFIEVI